MDPHSLTAQMLGQAPSNDANLQRPHPPTWTRTAALPIAFDIAGGSVRGRRHEKTGANNQDAFAWHYTDSTIIAVVCDGCGSSRNSEVGAKLGARMTVEALRAWLPGLSHTPTATVLEQVRLHLLGQFGELVKTMGNDPIKTILNYFLFTIVGAVITREKVIAFTHGDGVLAVNDGYTNLSYPDNAPPYLTYDLIRDALDPSIHDHLMFKTHWEGRPEEVRNLLIGTDGVDDFHLAADRCMPGKSEHVGPLSQFWHDDRYFTNPRGIRGCLKQVNRTVLQIDPEQKRTREEIGLLPDDTTFIVIRRKQERTQEE
ncbi:MAG: protein phosphatase 2C domain-containing protein [bacterium]|nr:protein phosphatase 2C domain-containing protein [bacterium]